MGLFKFEVKKIISTKKFKFLWIGVIILLGLYVILSSNADKGMQPYSLANYEETIEDLTLRINDFKVRIQEENDVEVKKDMESTVDRMEEELRYFEEIKVAIMEKDNDKILENSIKTLQNERDAVISGEISSSLTVEEYNLDIEKNKYLLENHIAPINEGVNMSMVNFLNLVLKYLAPMFIGIIIVLTTSDMVSKELDYGTIQILKFQGVSNKRLIVVKLLASIFVNLGSAFIVILGIASILGIINGVGEFNYPAAVQMKEGIGIVPVSNLIIKNSIIFICLIVFLTVFSVLISVIVKNSSEAISVAVTICVGTMLIFNNISLPEWIKEINPFSYLSGNEILLNGFSSKPIYSDVNIIYLIIIFSIYIGIAVLATIILFNKKEFNIES